MSRRLPPLRAKQSFLADARDGLREVAKRSWLRVTLAVDAVANFAIAPYFVLGPLVLSEQLGGASDWGLMMTAGAGGGIAGGALVLRWKPGVRSCRRICSCSLPLALLALVPPLPLPVLMLGSALFTLSIVVANTFWSTMEQQHVPNEALGRVDSISWMISLVIMPIGYVVTGPVAEAIGTRETLVLAAAIGAASSLAALASRSVRELRRLEDSEVAQAGVSDEKAAPLGPYPTLRDPRARLVRRSARASVPPALARSGDQRRRRRDDARRARLRRARLGRLRRRSGFVFAAFTLSHAVFILVGGVCRTGSSDGA